MSTKKFKSVDSLKNISFIKIAFKVLTKELKSINSLKSVGFIKTILKVLTVDLIINFIKALTVDFKALKVLDSIKININFISLTLKILDFIKKDILIISYIINDFINKIIIILYNC